MNQYRYIITSNFSPINPKNNFNDICENNLSFDTEQIEAIAFSYPTEALITYLRKIIMNCYNLAKGPGFNRGFFFVEKSVKFVTINTFYKF